LKPYTDEQRGVVYAVASHCIWGMMAVYFGFMRHINPMEIAVNRGVWSVVVAAIVVWWMGLFGKTISALMNPRYLLILTLTSATIVFNWTLYIWCIQQGRTLDASQGYFINPLMNVVVGYIFLGERFNKLQMVAIALAVVAVATQTIATGVFPFLGLSLAASFCMYGLLRKTIAIGAIEGFFAEVLIIAAPLLIVEYLLFKNGQTHFGDGAFNTLMLMGCGVLTTGALLFYSSSLKLIRYSTAGLLQYLSPTLVFLTAVFVFGEKLDFWKLVSFAMIWLALAIYTFSALKSDNSLKAN
jgi:chloramphenicol-sensitive protein RarD